MMQWVRVYSWLRHIITIFVHHHLYEMVRFLASASYLQVGPFHTNISLPFYTKELLPNDNLIHREEWLTAIENIADKISTMGGPRTSMIKASRKVVCKLHIDSRHRVIINYLLSHIFIIASHALHNVREMLYWEISFTQQASLKNILNHWALQRDFNMLLNFFDNNNWLNGHLLMNWIN